MKFQRSLAAAAVAALTICVPSQAQAAPPPSDQGATASTSPSPAGTPAAPTSAPAAGTTATPVVPAPVETAAPGATTQTTKVATPSRASTPVERTAGSQTDNASRAAEPAAVTPSAATPSAGTPIATLYAAQGGAAGWLGAAKGTEAAVPGVGGALWQRFANGDIYWSQATGAHYVNAAVRTMIADAGVGIVKLGLPKSDSTGTTQSFQQGTAWLRGGSAYAVTGSQLTTYGQQGGDGGPMGAPRSNAVLGRDGVGFQLFDRAIMWIRPNGNFVVSGSVLDLYGSIGGDGGPLGVPAGNAVWQANGVGFQQFADGIVWIRPRGNFAVYGSAFATYRAMGGDGGPLGEPTGNVVWQARGVGFQTFANGIMWIRPNGSYAVYGHTLALYGLKGGDGGPLGEPTGNVVWQGPGVGFQTFAKGIMWIRPRGTFAVYGQILGTYGSVGGDGGALGEPVGWEYPVKWGVAQAFQRGTIIINNGTVDVALNSHIDPRCTYGRVFCANKSDRKIRWMENGQIIYSMDARYGMEATGWGTEEGEQWISRKVRREVSGIDGSQMPYSMYFNNTGEAVHYSQKFADHGFVGGSLGCINVRDWAGVEWLYDYVVRVGDRVVVHR